MRYNPKYHSKEVLQCPKKRHPKKLMVWGCFSYHGCGKLYHCQKKVDSDEYCRIITTSLLPSSERLVFARPFIFQQDNTACHKSKKTMEYFDELAADGELYLLEWPPQSPDLNPIENLWAYFDFVIGDRSMMSRGQMWNLLEKTWEKIANDRELLRNLVDSMPRRIDAVLKAEGGPTKY